MDNTQITCPVCQTPIRIEIYSLLKGVKFSCPNCNATVGLCQTSYTKVETAMTKFEELKVKAGRA